MSVKTPVEIHADIVRAAIATAPTDDPAQALTAEVLRSLAALDREQTVILFESLVEAVSKIEPRVLTKATIRRALRPYAEPKPDDREHRASSHVKGSRLSSTPSTSSTDAVSNSTDPALTQHGPDEIDEALAQNEVADLLAERLRPALCWDETGGGWWRRPDAREWRPVSDAEARSRIRRAVDAVRGRYTVSFVSGVVALLRDDLRVGGWQEARHLLPVENGVYCLRERALREYVPADRFCWRLPYPYQPGADCPLIDEILDHAATITVGDEGATTVDAETHAFLIAWLYVVLTGRHEVQKYLELIGPGGTGKSTVIMILIALVGEANSITTELRQLESNRFESARLYGKRLAIIADSEAYTRDVSALKSLTGGDPIRNEKKHQQQGESFVYRGMITIAANEPIRSSDYTSGLARRRIPLTLSQPITDRQKAKYADPDDPDKFVHAVQDQMPGLLNKLLALDPVATIALVRNPEPAIQRSRLVAAIVTNPLLGWADECLVPCEPGDETNIGTRNEEDADRLYPSYLRWLDNEGHESSHSIKRFRELLMQGLGFHGIDTSDKRRASGRYLSGLRIRRKLLDADVPDLLSGRPPPGTSSTAGAGSNAGSGRAGVRCAEFAHPANPAGTREPSRAVL